MEVSVSRPNGTADLPVDVSVVIVTYNSADTIDACLNSIPVSHGRTEIVVVDNASSDSTRERLRRRGDAIRVVPLDENLGFARGCNRGVEAASGRHVLMLNPDTEVLADAIETAARYLDRHPSVGAVGAITLFADGTVNKTCCFAQPTLWSTFCRAIGLSRLRPSSRLFNPEEIGGWDRRSTREVGAITGCFFMIGRDFFSSLGGFDERFFMYSEDTDLSMRIQEVGRTCVHLHDVEVVHHGGRSDSVPAMKMVKVLNARAQLFDKHWSRSRARLGVWLLEVMVALRAAATRLMSLAGRASESKWPEVWRSRREWSKP